MSQLANLTELQFEVAPVPASNLGQPGKLQWIPIDSLMVDQSYQRPVDAAGKKNIRRIIENFHWSQFSPLVVAPRHGKVFAIIDGQHRAVGAKLHGGITELPCLVIACTPEEEARAFSTINGIVTRMHPQYLFRARIAAGDAGAVAADEAARAAGARIMPYPVAAHQLKPGETLSGKTIENELGRVGRKVVVAALELVTRTGDGNPGMVKQSIIEGFCDVLFGHPKWCADRDAARAAVERATIKEIFAGASRDQASQGGTLRSHLAARLTIVLRDALGDGGQAAAPAKTLGVQKREQAKRDAPKPAPRPIVAYDPKAVLRPQPKIAGGSSPVRADERALIEAHLQTKGVRRFEAGDTADDALLCDYLKRKGVEACRNTGRGGSAMPFRLKGKPVSRDEFFAEVNKHRAKDKLPPIGARK